MLPVHKNHEEKTWGTREKTIAFGKQAFIFIPKGIVVGAGAGFLISLIHSVSLQILSTQPVLSSTYSSTAYSLIKGSIFIGGLIGTIISGCICQIPEWKLKAKTN